MVWQEDLKERLYEDVLFMGHLCWVVKEFDAICNYLSVTIRVIDIDMIISISFTTSLAISGVISFIIGLKLWGKLRPGGLY